MEIDAETPAIQPYTILRIKRKRNEEPLDALVVESRVRRKKSRGIGVFQFAQTVENDAWQDERQAKDIQAHVSRLARESSTPTEAKSTTFNQETVSPQLPRAKDDSRRYTILNRGGSDVQTRRTQRSATNPPTVIPSKDILPKNLNSDFKMFDAVLESDESSPTVAVSDVDKFLPMLNDYLKLHDVTTDPLPEKVADGQSISSGSGDYVWDIFYHRPVTLSEWNEAANIGTLSGLPPSITNPYDSASESEEEDEADEDSNAEEYYKNDYPEDDPSSGSCTSSGDEFHESSDYEDILEDGQDDEHHWR